MKTTKEFDSNQLKNELNEKVQALFKDQSHVLNYLMETKKNFIYRYLETSIDKNVAIELLNDSLLIAKSYESNMGDAFKISHLKIKNGIKELAKSVPREKEPKVEYSFSTEIKNLNGDTGKLIITATVDWGFPLFSKNGESSETKKIEFQFNDGHEFRKKLALKYEEACEIFL